MAKTALLLEQLQGEFEQTLTGPALQGSIPRTIQFPDLSDKIKVAIGMRRAEKTYFVFQKIQKLLDSGIPLNNILYINFEDDRLTDLLESFFSLDPSRHEQPCYLFLDEIKNVDDWPIVIRRFFDTRKVEIFLTGSSAKLLSKEISTRLRGRSLAIEVWPFSFNEFLMAKDVEIKAKTFSKQKCDLLTKYFMEYITIGGFPEVTHYPDDLRQQVLQDYVDIVIFRDIIERYNIKNAQLIKYLILTLLQTSGSAFSVNKFYSDLW